MKALKTASIEACVKLALTCFDLVSALRSRMRRATPIIWVGGHPQ